MSTGRAACVAVVAALLLVAGATAAQRTSPDVTQTTLQEADLPAGTLVSKGASKPAGYVAGYRRSFEFAKPQGSSGIVYVQSEGDLATSVAQAKGDVLNVERAFRTKVGRAAFIKVIAAAAHIKAAVVRMSAVRMPEVGDAAFEQPFSLPIKGVRVYQDIVYVQLDRVVAKLYLAGIRPVTQSAAMKYASIIAGHVTTVLTPVAVAPPAVTGTAQQGQTLTASTGTWSNDDVVFAYQWQQCDATGTTCTDIAGATTATYVVAPTDVGFALRVVVTGTNRFGAPTAPSAVTPAVV
jgi:hypothetical protein